MAFNGKYLLPGKFGSAPAHFVVAIVAADRLNRTGEISLAVYSDAELRAVAKVAVSQIAGLQAAATLLRERQEKAGVGTSEETKAELSLEAKQIDLRFAQARKVIADNPALQGEKLNIGSDHFAEITGDDGAPQLAKVYNFLKTLPQFADATDA